MMFPSIAVRELTANALIHQDFSESGASVRIEIYSDRIEFTNLGIPSIPTERFIDEDNARNERLADLSRRLRLCEKRGSGLIKSSMLWSYFNSQRLIFGLRTGIQ